MREGMAAVDHGRFQLWMKMMKAGGLVKMGGYLPTENTKSS